MFVATNLNFKVNSRPTHFAYYWLPLGHVAKLKQHAALCVIHELVNHGRFSRISVFLGKLLVPCCTFKTS